MKKIKWIAILIALVMSMVLVGCPNPVNNGGSTPVTPDTSGNGNETPVTPPDTSGNGNETPATPVVPDTTAPAAVTNLNADAGYNAIILTWEIPADDDFAKVKIVVDGDAENPIFVLKTDEPNNSKTITGLTNGTEYTFEVYALDEAENVSEKAEAKATPVADLSKLLVDVSSRNLQVGDLIMLDEKVLPYSADYTAEEWEAFDKSNVVAIIVKEKDGDKKALGLGPKVSTWRAWATGIGSKTYFEDLVCTPKVGDSIDTYDQWEGDTEGSDNWEQICEYFDNSDLTDTQKAEGKNIDNYPAFKYAKNYATDEAGDTKLAGTPYESGWFLPSNYQAVEVLKNKDILKKLTDFLELGFSNFCIATSSQGKTNTTFGRLDWNPHSSAPITIIDTQLKDYGTLFFVVRYF